MYVRVRRLLIKLVTFHNKVTSGSIEVFRLRCCKFGYKSQTHFFFCDELLSVKVDFVGPLVDTADEGVACTRIDDEDERWFSPSPVINLKVKFNAKIALQDVIITIFVLQVRV